MQNKNGILENSSVGVQHTVWGRVKTPSNVVFKRFSLASCAVLLSLSSVAYAEPASPVGVTASEYEKEQYGNPDGELSKIYGWEENDDGYLEFKENPINPIGQTIEYKYTEQGFDTKEIGKENDLGAITNPTGTYDNPTQIKGGAVINNPAGTTISLDNVLYKDNVTKIVIESTTSVDKFADVLGGAVYNEGTISSITGAFINNSLDISKSVLSGNAFADSLGGAIANQGTIESIAADFIGNYASASSNSCGGAIYNGGKIGDITGDFIGNYISYPSSSYVSDGSAIYNSGTIGDISGDFIGNYTHTSSYSKGSVIYNSGTIGDITGDFIGNNGTVIETGGYSTSVIIGNITGNFIGNNGSALYAFAGYGAIKENKIGNITGDFINNSASNGGAIYIYNNAYNTSETTININKIKSLA